MGELGYPNGQDASIILNQNADIYVPGAVGAYTAPWTHWYLEYALGRVAELGFATDAIRAHTARFVIDMINLSGYPQLLAHYELPTEANCTNSASPPGCTAPPGGFYPTWAATVAALTPAYVTGANWPATGNSGVGDLAQFFAREVTQTGRDDGYPFWAMAGLAMAVDHGDAGATQAWRWYRPNVYQMIPQDALQGDPKWAIVPRTDTNTLPAQPTTIPSAAGAT